jgi:hypothetical protein
MYVYLNNLKKIINIKEKENIYLYTDQLIKLDINIIFGYILHELNKRIIKIPEYFSLCIKELEKNIIFLVLIIILLLTIYGKEMQKKF